MTKIQFDVKETSLASQGKKKIEWASRLMPVLRIIRERFSKEKPLKGITVSACLHVTSETANLLLVLKEGGAKPVVCASNPLSTQDIVAASLVKDFNIPTFAIKGEDSKTYYKHLNHALNFKPHITMDDGGDLIFLLHSKRKSQLKNVIGSSEETTTGVTRLRAMERDRVLKVPVMAVNESQTKYLFDNRYGTGQSTIDGIMRSTNVLIAGKTFVVAGFGWCGRGIAMRAKGMGAHVLITEVSPIRALEAVMDGYEVVPIERAVLVGDIFVTATGNRDIISFQHMEKMKDGVILANAGHFDIELDMNELEKQKKSKQTVRHSLDEYILKNGKKIYVIAEGRLVNLGAAEGHPPEVMDMSFANQALAAEYLVKNRGKLSPKVYTLPENLDSQVAMLKLMAMGISIDELTSKQKEYLSAWTEGTK